MKRSIRLIVCVLSIVPLFLMTACGEGDIMNEKSAPLTKISAVQDSSLEQLTEKKIFFAHQSVGFNLVDGIKDLIKDNSKIKLNLVETGKPEDFNKGIFAHAKNGKNFNPGSKIDAFAKTMEGGLAEKADIAFFKFCYVDFNKDTDINKVFNDYKTTMAKLAKKYPKTKFVHITAPIKVKESGVTTSLKGILGKGHEANIKRNQYNEMLKKEYSGSIFDLAQYESTHPDGKREGIVKDGKSYYTLIPEYSHDGEHLNEKGRKIVAEQFLIFLSGLSK
ncbi:MAG: hypothetical protein GY754_46420 [bacterium]|nr:hypothetical protein [bacterium]